MRVEHDRGRSLAREAASNVTVAGDIESLPRSADETSYLGDHAARLLQEALSIGMAATWRRRQRAWLNARPRPGDFPGQASREDLRRRWHELTVIAEACAHRAEVAERHTDGIEPEVWDALAEAGWSRC